MKFIIIVTVIVLVLISNVNSYKSSLTKLRLNNNIIKVNNNDNNNRNNKNSKLESVCGCINNVISSPLKAGQLFSSMSSCKKVMTLAPLAAILTLFIM